MTKDLEDKMFAEIESKSAQSYAQRQAEEAQHTSPDTEHTIAMEQSRSTARSIHARVCELQQIKSEASLIDWAESILCNSRPMSHCSQEEWDAIIAKWRDTKHGTAAAPETARKLAQSEATCAELREMWIREERKREHLQDKATLLLDAADQCFDELKEHGHITKASAQTFREARAAIAQCEKEAQSN